jgi:three-Cys-motif partner protein
MAEQRFGSTHTDTKLQKLAAYLRAFNTALKNKPSAASPFERVYVDAFAGTGEIETAESSLPLIDGAEMDAFIPGSVRRALEVEPPFHRYVFAEQDAGKAKALQTLVSSHADKRCEIHVGDANEMVASVVRTTNWTRTRAVVFLDPFGSQVSWSTLELLAATKAVDLWYLFPSGLSVLRQISRSGRVLPEHRPALDRIFGPNDWESVLVKREAAEDLFGNSDLQLVHRASADQITQFMIDCMSKIFAGGVHPRWLPLGSRNIHMYSLIFACANPSRAASNLAHRLAGAVLSAKKK